MPVENHKEWLKRKQSPFDKDDMYMGLKYIGENWLGHPKLECPKCKKKQCAQLKHLKNGMKMKCNCKK